MQRYNPYRMTRAIWHQQIWLLVKTVLYSVTFLISCAILAYASQLWDVYRAGQLGYWMIAGYGVGSCLKHSLWRIVQVSGILLQETRRQRQIMQRYRRIQGL